MHGRPFISFVVLTCNQVPFVKQALEGAFGQTYRPLEIVLSDDCSTDGTWEVAHRLAREYSGPHSIRLVRQGSRKGVVGHFNTAAAMAAGDLIVLAAGDDVSLPHRAQAIWRTWHSSGGSVHTFCSRYHTVDENGAPITYPDQELVGSPRDGGAWYFAPPHPWRFLSTHHPGLCGATLAFHRDQFHHLGPLPGIAGLEDLAMAFRAMLRGGLAIVNDPLVLYRRHGTNTFNMSLAREILVKCPSRKVLHDYRRQYRKNTLQIAATYRGMQNDLRRAKERSWIGRASHAFLAIEAKRQETIYRLRAGMHSRPWPRRSIWWLGLLCLGAPRWVLRDLSPFLVPDCWWFRRRRGKSV